VTIEAKSQGDCGSKTTPDSWREALFADLLRSIRLRRSFYFLPELQAPWGFSIARKGAVFHIVVHGTCWLEVKGVAAIQLSAGDFVVVPRGRAHLMRNTRATPVENFFDLVKRSAPDKRGAFSAGGNGPVTRLVCGGMQFENGPMDPLLAVLPPLIHVKGKEGEAAPWLRATVVHILEELNLQRPGAEAVVTRLADILFIQAVRSHFDEDHAAAESGWLAAVRDPHIGPAVALLHEHPQELWTVASLAHRVALSRSVFATRFTQLVGEPPLRYLTRLRLNVATTRLRSSNDKLSAIAAAAGYESVAAFIKVFKRHFRMTPGEYRRGRQLGGSAYTAQT
jgi:AraC-like DNA-binding protein